MTLLINKVTYMSSHVYHWECVYICHLYKFLTYHFIISMLLTHVLAFSFMVKIIFLRKKSLFLTKAIHVLWFDWTNFQIFPLFSSSVPRGLMHIRICQMFVVLQCPLYKLPSAIILKGCNYTILELVLGSPFGSCSKSLLMWVMYF